MLSHDNADYKITAVPTPFEALNLISQKPFDLFVFDYQLPEMSGVELCRRIRETDQQTPILFFTGMAGNDERNIALSAGASHYLVKPNDLEKFTETVRLLLNEKQEALKAAE
jgi:DNA-binding response OmpR family regulator